MTNPLSDPIEIKYRHVAALWRYGSAEHARTPDGHRIHNSKEGALAAAAQEARSQGAPEDARVILDYDAYRTLDRVTVDWHTPESAGQPMLIRRMYECFRLSEVPR